MAAQWNNPRDISKRIIIQGRLILETPAHLGCGDSEGLLDMALMRDAYSGGILLTGSTLAGALKGYLTGLGDLYAGAAKRLFGEVKDDLKESRESWLIVEDAVSAGPQLETRDGVALSGVTGAAEDKAKYDIELLSAGSEFVVGFELLVPKEDEDQLVETLAIALLALENGEIRLGKRKRRGFGKCKVTGWKVWEFAVDEPEGMLAWLQSWPLPAGELTATGIDQLLLGRGAPAVSAGSICTLTAEFTLDSPLLIRSTPEAGQAATGEAAKELPDTVHLRSRRGGHLRPIISGTSFAGALRSRATRICSHLGLDARQRVDSLFGNRRQAGDAPAKGKQKWTSSRLWVDEIEINGPLVEDLTQTRVMIDRFTGGAHPGALFSEQPVFPKAGNTLTLRLRLQVKDGGTGDIGLLVLLLKDLWAGHLTLGGESSIGRGRLKGKSALLEYGGDTWTITDQDDGSLAIDGDQEKLNAFLEALKKGE